MDNKTTESSISMEQKEKWGLMDYIRAVGPAIIIAAVVIGPGSVTTASSMGANNGYEPLWIVVLAALAAFMYQEPAIRITINKQVSIMEAVRLKYSPALAKILFALVFFGTLVFQAGNFIGAGMAMNYFAPQLSTVAWTFTIIVLGMIMALASAQGIIENFTKVLVALMVGAFIITAVGSGPDPARMVAEGFSFKIPGGDWFLVLALLATTMVPDIPLSLSALYKNKYCNPATKESSYSLTSKLKFAKVDLTVSMTVTALITLSIVICSATILHPMGVTVSSAADMALQLTPILGRYAGILFSLGLWAAAFSSGLFRMTLMPMLFNQAAGYEDNMKAVRSRVLIVLTGVIPMIIVAVFGAAPVQLVVTAQAINGLLLPFICAIVWKLSSDRGFLGDKANGKVRNVLFGILLVVTVLLAVRVFLNILGLI